MVHEAWVSLTEEGKKAICELLKEKKLHKDFNKIKDIDATQNPFISKKNNSDVHEDESLESRLAAEGLVNAAFETGNYKWLAGSLDIIFGSFLYVEHGCNKEEKCILTSDQGYIYTTENGRIEGYGPLYEKYKHKRKEFNDKIDNIAAKLGDSNTYDFSYCHYFVE